MSAEGSRQLNENRSDVVVAAAYCSYGSRQVLQRVCRVFEFAR